VLGGKFVYISTNIKNSEKPQINNLVVYLKFLKNINKPNPKSVRSKEIIKIMVATLGDIPKRL
jgi:hypothetical protein